MICAGQGARDVVCGIEHRLVATAGVALLLCTSQGACSCQIFWPRVSSHYPRLRRCGRRDSCGERALRTCLRTPLPLHRLRLGLQGQRV